MANQVVVTQSGNVQVNIEPQPNVQVQISRAAIGNITVSNVAVANTANYAHQVLDANQPNITGLGTLGNLVVSGNTTTNNLTVTGNLSVGNLFANNANYANFANIANIANVANSVNVANVVGIGNIATINLSGNGSETLLGNGTWGALPNTANANYANYAGNAFSVNGSNVVGDVSGANHANIADVANSVAGANVSGTVANANYAAYAGNATVANTANSVAGANVSGEVAYAAVANSVAVANVSGIGNIAVINLDGNASNILYGNGVFGPDLGPQDVANANYANFAGTAYNVSGSNVSGDVAGANHANIADVANSVAGANVSGTVANANFALYSNVSNSANSVAVANVVGIGNIATINLDGNGANVLHGNGVFAPEASNGNANYANFAGNALTLANGTSNVNIPVANGNVQISVNGNANIGTFDSAGTGALTLNPLINQNNGLRITSVGRAGAGNGASRLTWIKSRGTLTTPLSVEPTDYVAEILGLGHNGAAYQTNSVAFVRAQVDSSYTANGANIPIGWQIIVNDTNGGVNNQSKVHNFYSNGNVSFANSIFATTVNGTLIGDGGNISNITGSNVTGQVAYAAVANSVAVANVVGIGNIATINLDGNSSNVLLGNGVFSGVPSQSIISNGTSNVSIPSSNGNVQINSGGNLLIDFNGSGGVMMNAYPLSTMNNYLRVNSVARGGNAAGAARLASSKSRGTNASPLSVQPNDYTAEFITWGHNGSAYQTNSIGFIRAQVDNSYIANGANIPIGWSITVNDTNGGVNNQNKTHNFYSNGVSSFAGNVNVAGNINISGLGTSYTLGNFNVGTGAGELNAQQLTIQGYGNGTTAGTIFLYGNADPSCGFRMFNAPFTAIMDNVNPFTGISPFFFNTYDNSNNYVPPQRFFRARGTQASTLPVQAGDQVASQSYAVYGDSGNTYLDVTDTTVTVDSNDNAGNVATTYNVTIGAGTAGKANSKFYVDSAQTQLTGSLSTANTLSINIDNNTTQGLLQQVYNNANIQTGQWTSWRHRGNVSTPLPVQAGDEISKFNSVVYADSGNTYTPVFQQITNVLSNDLAGNVSGQYQVVGYGANSITQFYAKEHQFGNIALSTNATIFGNGDASFGNVSASNVSVNTNGFVKLANYTTAALTAITGQIGWMAAVSDSAAGSNPNGMIAFWDTTNSRWSYVHDNSAV